MELKDSVTRENLLRAFAGESQARNRYLSKRPTIEAVSPVWISLATGKAVAFLFCAWQHFHVLELV